jgi:hypothetical protein
MADLSAVVGFVGFCRGMGATNRKWRRDYRIWCSGGAEGMVRGQGREESEALRGARRAEASLPCSVGP